MSGRVRITRRVCLLAFVVAGGGFGLDLHPAAAAAAHPTLAGHWHITYYLRCTDASRYAPVCAVALQVKLPVPDESKASFVTQRTLDIFSDTRGRFTFQSRIVTIEQSPGAVERCHSYVEETGTLSDICEMTSQGNGHVAKGRTGALDFWMEQRTTTYHGHRLYRITRSTVLDSLTPASPGCWDTPRVLGLHGLSGGPPGLVARVSVMHSGTAQPSGVKSSPLDCSTGTT
ncbi:MAG TPA: hypothetical protein VF221_21185 [Chloroflexota bacterium]